jgi:predicted phage terminase large subunit-like protein
LSSKSLDRRAEEALLTRYAMCERSLAYYFKCAWRVLEQRTELHWNWHIDCVAEYLEAVELGQIKRLLITMPPRNIKSNMVTIVYPSWVWIRKPETRFMAVSYAANLSTDQSVKRRRLLESDFYQTGYGTRFRLASDQNVKTEFSNDKSGSMFSTSITGASTGKGCNRLLIDDPVNPKEANSEAERSRANQDYDSTFPSRLNDKKNDVIIGVMQRLHPDDWIGHVKERDTWTHLNLPAEAATKHTIVFPISKREVVREAGSILHAEREGPKELAAMKKTLGSRMFEAQYNQNPTLAEGDLIKRSWWRRYKKEQLPERFDQIIQSWDLAVKDKDTSDYTVGTIWGRLGPDKYLLDRYRARVDFPGQCQAVLMMTRRWPNAYKKIIEAKANGPAVVQTMKKHVSGIVEYEPKGDKIARVNAIAPEIESGNVFIPHSDSNDWVDEFLDEWCAFPNGSFDDQVDSGSQALDLLRRSGTYHAPITGHGSGIVF